MNKDFSRRGFLERLGGLALGAGALSQISQGRSTEHKSAAAAWTAPPPLSNPNILVVMVDQMRWPCWLDAKQTTIFEQQIVPNIVGRLRNNSYVFDQYYTAATICTAARGTLLSGLYAPQTACYTNTLSGPQIPALATAFPTWAIALQALNPAYQNNLWWFGKWHLSSCGFPSPLKAYGFNTRTYPSGVKYPSPNGVANEGTDGGPFGGKIWANDSLIASDFIGWLQGKSPTPAPPASPWCATVSLINPHDIAEGPAWLQSNPFPPVGVPKKAVYFPPPQFPPANGAPAVYTKNPSPWNYEDLSKVTNKPALQYAFQKAQIHAQGKVTSWVTFLNWYYWLHNYVDVQVGRVLDALNQSAYAANTVVIFLADHGEYGGSHGLHDKGAAAYEESIHVPLFVHFPGQTGSIAMNQMSSSVDFFGLICDLGTGGSDSWQLSYPDLIVRQSLWNFLYNNSAETRIAPNLGVPYILHTSDDDAASGGEAKHHIVCMRTKTDPQNAAQPGAKLAVYSAWAKCQTMPNSAAPDYEFYDYNPATTNNQSEFGNDYFSSNPATQQTLAAYLSELGNWTGSGLVSNELNRPLTGTGTDGNPLTQAQTTARQNYFDFQFGVGACKA